MDKSVTQIKCSNCGIEKTIKGERVPTGWKRRGEEVFCGNCWGQKYILRAITIPVAGPINIEWDQLRALLKKSWEQSTALANWTINTLAKNDVVRTPALEKCPKMEPMYLYPLARAFMPDMPTQSLNGILRTAEAKYRASRLETIWRHAAALPTFRYPVPFPVPSRAWSARYLSETEKVPILRVRLCDTPVELRLRGGPEFARQLRAFADIVSGDASGCEAAIYQVSAHKNDHRSGMTTRENAGGTKFQTRIMVKIVAWLPRREPPKRAEKTMLLATATDHFWVGTIEGREPWLLNADHVRKWIIEHAKFRQRVAEDTKPDHGSEANVRQRINDAVAIRCRKQNNRLDSFCHMATASIVRFASRQGVTTIQFDARCKEYLPSFPWFKLRELLGQKCDAEGIEIIDVKESASDEAKKQVAGEVTS